MENEHLVICAHCGTEFTAFRNDATYCSNACAGTASRRRTAHRRDVAEDLLARIIDASTGPADGLAPLIAEARRTLADIGGGRRGR